MITFAALSFKENETFWADIKASRTTFGKILYVAFMTCSNPD